MGNVPSLGNSAFDCTGMEFTSPPSPYTVTDPASAKTKFHRVNVQLP